MKISLDGFGQVDWIAWSTQEPRPALDDVLSERSHVGGDYGQAKGISQDEDTALGDLRIGQCQYVRRFKVHLTFLIRDVLDPLDDPLSTSAAVNRPLDLVQVGLAALRQVPDENQAISRISGRDSLECSDQKFEAFVGPDVAKEQDRLFTVLDAQARLRLLRSEIRVRNGIVDPERDDGDGSLTNTEMLQELTLHLFRMNEDVIGKVILNSEG